MGRPVSTRQAEWPLWRRSCQAWRRFLVAQPLAQRKPARQPARQPACQPTGKAIVFGEDVADVGESAHNPKVSSSAAGSCLIIGRLLIIEVGRERVEIGTSGEG